MTQPKSKEGAMRQYDANLNAYRRDFAGGGSFGFDWATMRLNSPDRYERARHLSALFKTLPSRSNKD